MTLAQGEVSDRTHSGWIINKQEILFRQKE